MQKDQPQTFSHTTLALHWIVAVAMICLLAVGIYMEETEAYALYPWHKAFGVLVGLVALLRIVWRVMNGWPAPLGDHAQWERRLAKVVHWVLILATVLMPLSGFLMSSLGGHGVAVFGLELVAANPDPANPGKVLAHNADLAKLAHSLHGAIGNLLIAAILLHIAGAWKHHLLDGDATLRRMLGRT